MATKVPRDVPSPIDHRTMEGALEFERTANVVRPFRAAFFELFATEIKAHTPQIGQVLELGSGPGFLAEHVLSRLPELSYVALDYSPAMNELARKRLRSKVAQVTIVERSFKEANWFDGLGLFWCVVTNQAVHELRHKRYAPTLHEQVRSLLPADGLYLFCDHFCGDGGQTNSELYMTKAEQRASLVDAGFAQVELIKSEGPLAMHRAQ